MTQLRRYAGGLTRMKDNYTDLFIVLLQGSQVLTGLAELTLLHTLTHIPVNEGTLGVHQVKLVVQPREHLSNGCGVGDHAHSTLYLGKVTAWHNSWWLVVDATPAKVGCWSVPQFAQTATAN